MPLKENTETINYSMKFSFVDFDMLNDYDENCHHPNTPWLCCCGCGLGGCLVNKQNEWDYDLY